MDFHAEKLTTQTAELQAVVDRAKKHDWRVCERCWYGTILTHRNTLWGVRAIIHDGRILIERV